MSVKRITRQTLLDKINSPTDGAPCDCCGEPMYDPAHALAREIFALFPATATPDPQKTYDEAIEIIEQFFGMVLAIGEEMEAPTTEMVN